MPSGEQLRNLVGLLRQELGVPGVVVLTALLVDLSMLMVAGAYRLAVVPGILAFTGCALWAQRRALVASVAGAAALLASTALIRLVGGGADGALLTGISVSETVAGIEMVVFCAWRARPSRAAAVIAALVLATFGAVVGRSYAPWDFLDSADLLRSGLFGLVILVGSVSAGVYLRRIAQPVDSNRWTALLGIQWPVVALLSLVFFLEASAGLDSLASSSVVLCSLAALAAAAIAGRTPARSALVVAAAIALSGVLLLTVVGDNDYSLVEGIAPGQVVAGLTVVIFLVRDGEPGIVTRRIALMSAAVAFGVIANRRDSGEMLDAEMLLREATMASVALGVAVAVGLYFRARDSERAKTMQAAVREAQTGERMALARELHDVVAHQVTGIVVQAQAARMVADTKPEVAQQALGRIEEGGLEALAAMRRLVGSMRGAAPGASPGDTATGDTATTDFAADLRALVDRKYGVPVTLELDLDRDVPLEVARTVLRLVQESLTNIDKHAASASTAHVLARGTDTELHLKISDNGVASAEAPVGGSGGYGIVGMRERVALLGGLFTAGPGPEESGGWQVEAWLPLS